MSSTNARRLAAIEDRYRRAQHVPAHEKGAAMRWAMTPADRATYQRLVAKYEPRYEADPESFTLEVLEPEDDAMLSCIFLRAYRRLGWSVSDEYWSQMEACAS